MLKALLQRQLSLYISAASKLKRGNILQVDKSMPGLKTEPDT